MADKSFGVKELNLLGSSGTPSIESPNDLNLNANTVAISTNLTVGSKLSVTSAGIVTAVSGVVTYYGDGQYLSGTGGGGGSVPGIDTTGTSTFEDIVVNGNAGIGSLNVTGVSTFVGRVGIGTIPAAKLHISGPAEIRLNNAADAGNFARILCFEEGGDNAANLAFHVGSGEVLRIDNDGNVGIGTSVPTDPVTSLNTTQLSVGIVSATSFYGDGQYLSGIMTSGGIPGINTTGTSTFEDITVNGNAGIGSLNVTGVSTFNDNVYLKDDKYLYFGNGDDANIYFDGSNFAVNGPTSNQTYLRGHTVNIGANGGSGGFNSTILVEGDGGNQRVSLYHNGNKKLETTSSGVDVTGNLVASGNVSGVDGTFTGNVSIGGTLTYEDVTNVDSVGLITAQTGIRVSSGGKVLIGHNATVDTSTYNSNLQVMGTNADGSSITVGRFSDDSSSPSLSLSKSRSQSVGIGSSVKNNDVIGNIFWWGDDGGDYEEVAHIGVQAGAAFTSGSTPGYLTFWTTPVDATIAIERLRIDSSGHITQKFTTNNSTTAEGLFINNKNNGTGNNASLIFSNDSGERKKAALAYIDTGDYGTGDLVFALDGADSGNLHLTDDEKVRITLDGDVGIGTTNPTATNITDALQSNTSVLAVGVVTAKTFYGDGTFLTGTGGGTLISGITVQEESSNVGTAGSIKILNFQGSTITATADGDDTAVITVSGLAEDSQYNLYAGTNAGANSDTDTCYNIGIGYSAAYSLNSGDNNVILGKQAGACLTSGQYNIFLGCHTGYNSNGTCNFFAVNGAGCHNDTGINNVFIGSGAGQGTGAATKDASHNIAIGNGAGSCLDSGDYNVFIGVGAGSCTYLGAGCNIFLGWCAGKANRSGYKNIVMGCEAASGSFSIVRDGSDNVILGSKAGCMLDTGDHNVFLGACAGIAITSGGYNIGLGYSAGASLWGGSGNILLGNQAGKNLTTGNCNIAIGRGTIFPSATGDCQLVIGQCLGNWIVGDCCFNVGIGTTNPNAAVGVGNTAVLAVGILSAYQLYGDGSCLSGIATTGDAGFSPDAQNNLYAGAGAGQASDSTTQYNVAIGYSAGYSLDEGDCNVLIGGESGYNITSGCYNTFVGGQAGKCHCTGSFNVALGQNAGQRMCTGTFNTLIGPEAGFYAEGAGCNVAIGHQSGYHNCGGHNTFLGRRAGYSNCNGSSNVAIGDWVKLPIIDGSHQLAIGVNGTALESGLKYWIVGNSDFNIGIGTTNPNAAVGSGNTAKLSVGIVSAYTYYGDGSNLTGVGGETLISGITVQEESSNVGTGGSITILDFQGANVTATASGSNKAVITVAGADSLWVSNDTGIHTTSNVGIGTTTNLSALLTLSAPPSSNNDLIVMSAAGAASTERITIGSTTLDNGTISFEGSEGTLFSITNNLSSGSIFSVNDISGIPSIDVDADGTIQLAPLGSATGAKVGIGTTNPSSALHVVGDVKVTGVVTATDFDSTSDIRLKTNIKLIDDPLAKVVQIEGVSFNWKKDNRPALGVIADQIEKVIPELVHGDDPKTVNYNGLVGLLIEVVKDQQTQIDDLNKRLSKLE